MKFTGENKKRFEKWWGENKESPTFSMDNDVLGRFYPDFELEWFSKLPDSMKWGVQVDYVDSIGGFIHIEPHLGGGAPVFYLTITWRNKDFIDEFWSPRLDNMEIAYYNTREEAMDSALSKFDELENQKG